mmetsp:Transcript_17092/g.30995  ORF Transcript_17092/g.30995 Transcript_17092/m.30995 type:complete len:391 (+) Transcript_17092:215-1387(+)
MVYILADGSVSKQPPLSRNPIKFAARWFASPRAAITIAVVVAACSTILDFSPLANGAIPAAKKKPHEHWSYMARDMSFVRKMTEGLVGKTKATTKEAKKRLKNQEIMGFIQKVDFGGPDGHVAEESDLLDLEEIRVTRCSTTRSAITAYMCGADIATDQDIAHGHHRKTPNFGTKSFRGYLNCRHQQGRQTGNHRRSVYRLGISCKGNLAGYSHAFNIIAQPDGTYFWLQSFIGHYSLATWMKKVDNTKESGLSGHLTHVELMQKLDKVDRLMNIFSWNSQSNDDYLDLFNVDKKLKTMSGNRGRQLKKWTLDHCLDTFAWDEACEYPLPDEYHAEDQTSGQNTVAEDGASLDKCTILLADISLSSFLSSFIGIGGLALSKEDFFTTMEK